MTECAEFSQGGGFRLDEQAWGARKRVRFYDPEIPMFIERPGVHEDGLCLETDGSGMVQDPEAVRVEVTTVVSHGIVVRNRRSIRTEFGSQSGQDRIL